MSITVGYGGKLSKDAPWILTWLPTGYAPTAHDRVVAYFAEPPNGWNSYSVKEGNRPPLIEAVCATIEKFMAEHPGYEIGYPTSMEPWAIAAREKDENA